MAASPPVQLHFQNIFPRVGHSVYLCGLNLTTVVILNQVIYVLQCLVSQQIRDLVTRNDKRQGCQISAQSRSYWPKWDNSRTFSEHNSIYFDSPSIIIGQKSDLKSPGFVSKNDKLKIPLPRYVPFCANLTEFQPILDMPDTPGNYWSFDHRSGYQVHLT